MTTPSSLKWRINPRVAHETIDGEVVVINLDSGSYYSLDLVGTDVWALVETGASIDQIVENITWRYDGSRADVEPTIVRLINELRQEELIVTDGTHVTEGSGTASELDGARLEPEKRRLEAPVLRKYTDMQELLLLDPVHEVDVTGWPHPEPERAKAD